MDDEGGWEIKWPKEKGQKTRHQGDWPLVGVVATTFMIKPRQLPAQLFGKCPVFL